MKPQKKIVFMSQPSLIQQGQNGNNIPSLIGQPLIPIDMTNTFTSYTQMNREIIQEVMQSKMKERLTAETPLLSMEDINNIYKHYKHKCDLHSIKLSDKCRQCKVIINNIKQSNKLTNSSHTNNSNTLLNNNMNIENTKDNLLRKKKVNNIDYIHFQDTSISGNLNTLLLNNILSCQYFKEVIIFKTFNELIEEIKNNVTNIEPWARAFPASSTPSRYRSQPAIASGNATVSAGT